MNSYKKTFMYFILVINVCVFAKKTTINFDVMNEKVQQTLSCPVCTDNAQECVVQMQKRCALAKDIYNNARSVLGENYLSVKQLKEMMSQCEQTIITIRSGNDQSITKKMMSESTKKDEGIADALLLKAIDVSQQTKKWVEKGQTAEKVAYK